jgi:predicted peptidase
MPQKPVQAAEWEDFDDMVMAELEAAQQELNIDKRHISLTGLSQGGHGTWTIGAHHPNLFSALAPCCGYIHTRHASTTPPPDLTAYLGKPIWAFHGEKDDVVPPAESKDMILALKKAHQTPDPKLTLYPDANHNCWDKAYRDEKLGQWLTK